MPKLANRGVRRLLLASGPALVAIVVGVLAVDAARRTREVGAWVDHSHVVIETAEHLLARMVDAETAQRGYVITGDETILQPALGADREVGRALDSLAALTVDDAAQQRRVATLLPLVVQRFAQIAETMRLRRSVGAAAAGEAIASSGSRDAMDSVRAEIGGIVAEEERLLASRRATVASHARTAVTVVVAGTLLAGLLGLLANLMLAASASAEARAARELARANERLNEQAAELAQQNERLQQQTVELEMQQEQLQTQQVELEMQTDELQSQAAQVRALNASLESQVHELAALNAGLESFSYSVSHDLRTPLGAINGMSALLQEDYGERLDDAGRDMLARVRANAMHMGELIDGLLELARVSRGNLKVERVDLTQLAREIGGGLARQAPDRAVRFEVEEGLTVCADRRLVAALLQNLLTNAWKFTGKAAAPAIEVRRDPAGPPDTFFVRDNGAGFDMAYATRLFAAFQRLHAKEYEGTGIGLATVDRVVRRHGGAVRAEGEVGKGATFFVTLPGGAC